jgi:hypothetical protein
MIVMTMMEEDEVLVMTVSHIQASLIKYVTSFIVWQEITT